MNTEILQVEKLTHKYLSVDNSLPVIDNLSFSLKKRSIIGILGPSGCGKSTIIKIISGLIKPTNGTILIDNDSPSVAAQQKKIGIAFQDDNLLEWLSVKENILLPLNLGRPTRLNSYRELIQIIGLESYENYYPSKLSGGMKQRVILARALITNPEILLLDEPFKSIDMLTRSKLMFEFYKIINHFGISVILVTHSIEEAVFMANEIFILNNRPTSIKKVLANNFKCDRDLKLLETKEFIEQTINCRHILFESKS